MRKLMILVLLLIGSEGCATASNPRPMAEQTLLVTNTSMAQIAIYARSYRIGQVSPFQSGCLSLRYVGNIRLEARQIAGFRISPDPINTLSYAHWEWELSESIIHNFLSLKPRHFQVSCREEKDDKQEAGN